jgi:para-nitrobenzyl esterase
VATSLGRVRGEAGAAVHRFQRLPYAAPPVGALRWRAPQPPAPWSGELDATRPGPTAPQILGIMRDLAPQSEDCLYANVWTPDPHGRRPVMLFVHGGGFTAGASTHAMYDGAALAARGDLVVVSFNYRLGALGYADVAALAGDDGAFDVNLCSSTSRASAAIRSRSRSSVSPPAR